MTIFVADLDSSEGALDSWPMVPLGELGQWGSGGTPKRGIAGYYNGEIPWLKISDLTDGDVGGSEEKITPLALQNSSAKLLQPGALLIAMYGSIGKLGLNTIACATNQAIAFCYPNERVSLKYLFWALRAFRPLLISEGKGGTQQNISQGVLKDFKIPVPPRARQDQIVHLIESTLDALGTPSNRLAALPALLKKFRQSVLAAACSGQLTADWRESQSRLTEIDSFIQDIERARLLSRAKTPKNAQSEPTPVFDVPDSWRWVSLRTLVELKGGVTKGEKRRAGQELISVPYLRVANVQRGFLDLSDIKHIEATPKELEELRLQPNDILFNEGGDRDKLGRGWVWEGQIDNCIHQNHVFRGRLFDDRIPAKLVSLYGNSIGAQHFIDEGKQTVNLASLSITKLGDMAFPLAPPEEMEEIMRQVESLFALADSIESRLTEATAQVGRTTQVILAKAFRGEL